MTEGLAKERAVMVTALKKSALRMAGVGGFEPPHGWTKTSCLTAWRHPNLNGCAL